MSNQRWVKMACSNEIEELIRKNQNAFILAVFIAKRARFTNEFNEFGLTIGQAFIGDHDSMGMTERQYRTSKQVLSNAGFATFKPTPKGTIATLTDSRLFIQCSDPGDEQNDIQPSDKRRTADGQPTTNQNESEGFSLKENHQIALNDAQGTVPSKKSKPIVDKITSDHSKLITKWCNSYKQHFGRDYKFQGGRDGKAVKELLKVTSVEEIIQRATKAWAHQDNFHCRNCVTLGYLSAKWNEVNAEIARATNCVQQNEEWKF